MKHHSKILLDALDVSLAFYVLLTSILILFFYKELPSAGSHLLVRVFVLTLIISMAYLVQKFNKHQPVKFIKLFWPLLLLGFFYSETDALNNLIFKNNLDPIFEKIDFQLFGFQPADLFSQKLHSTFFSELMYFGYFSYYMLIVGIPLIIYFKFGSIRTQKTIFLVINSFLIYYLVFILLPVAGPQFHWKNSALSLPQGYLFGWLIRTIQHYGEAPTAAFPSSHVSICLMLVYITFKYIKKLLYLVIPVAVLLILSTIYLKAHYAIDVLAAFFFTPLIYYSSNKIYGYLNLKLKPNESCYTRS